MLKHGGRLHLLARIGGERVALAADDIESVVEVEAMSPVPCAGPHVAGLAPLRSRVLTIIDSNVAIGLPPPPAGLADRPAVVVSVDGHCFGLLVDEVEDVVAFADTPRPAGAGLAAGWRRVTEGLVEHDGEALLLVAPAALVAGPAGRA